MADSALAKLERIAEIADAWSAPLKLSTEDLVRLGREVRKQEVLFILPDKVVAPEGHVTLMPGAFINLTGESVLTPVDAFDVMPVVMRSNKLMLRNAKGMVLGDALNPSDGPGKASLTGAALNVACIPPGGVWESVFPLQGGRDPGDQTKTLIGQFSVQFHGLYFVDIAAPDEDQLRLRTHTIISYRSVDKLVKPHGITSNVARVEFVSESAN
jgi:hypothetical protein